MLSGFQIFQIWLDAGTQVFFSYAICFGCQIALGSYNKYHNNFMKDCFIICCFNSGTSLLNGVVIFSVLGYMSHESGLSISEVATGNIKNCNEKSYFLILILRSSKWSKHVK